MNCYNFIQKNRYFDSVLLMNLSGKLAKLPGVARIYLLSGTDNNKELLKEAKLLTPKGEEAGPADLIIAAEAENLSQESLLSELDKILKASFKPQTEYQPRSLKAAFQILPDADLVFLSIPGEFVRREAELSLEKNAQLMIFSDNVPLSDELAIKQAAREKGLLVMGPDCGTAILNRVGLGFYNQVPQGEVGMVAASGTGIQQVSCLLASYGIGISQAIGTGSSDLKYEIGGLSTLTGIEMLAQDPRTELLILLSKPPHPEVKARILSTTAKLNKNTLACFLGSPPTPDSHPLYFASTLEETALKARSLLTNRKFELNLLPLKEKAENFKLPPGRKYLRGLFSGGTLCLEAEFILKPLLGEIFSNITPQAEFKLKPPFESKNHTLLDLGDDYFTRGRPHPMIELSYRLEKIKIETQDPECGVILFDIVLGFGSHLNPAQGFEELLKSVSSSAEPPLLICALCGTPEDPQDFNRQKAILENAGVICFPSSTSAAYFAGFILGKEN